VSPRSPGGPTPTPGLPDRLACSLSRSDSLSRLLMTPMEGGPGPASPDRMLAAKPPLEVGMATPTLLGRAALQI
jgi:hypothetical protein